MRSSQRVRCTRVGNEPPDLTSALQWTKCRDAWIASRPLCRATTDGRGIAAQQSDLTEVVADGRARGNPGRAWSNGVWKFAGGHQNLSRPGLGLYKITIPFEFLQSGSTANAMSQKAFPGHDTARPSDQPRPQPGYVPLYSSVLPVSFSVMNLRRMLVLLVNSSSLAGASPPFLMMPSKRANSLATYVSLFANLAKTLT